MIFTKPRLALIFSKLYVPITLLGLTLLAYAPLISSLGFYWDDWPLIWFGHLLGSRGYLEVLASDRPFLAGVYLFSTSILGDSPVQWQIFGIITRWAVTLSAWWALSKFWKNKPQQVFWIAALLAVYPGFKQQPISVIYSNGYLLLIAFFLSFGFTTLAVRNRQRFWVYSALAVLMDLFCSFSTEYYFGLNLVRIFLIYFLVRQPVDTFWLAVKKTLLFWIPYAISMAAFLLWRVVVFGFPTYEPQTISNISSGNLSFLGKLLFRVFSEPLITGILAWLRSFRFPVIEDFSTPSQLLFWIIFAVGLVFSVLILFYFSRMQTNEIPTVNHQHEPDFIKSAFWVGLAALVLPGIPYWITNLPIELNFPYDRFTLAFMFGSSILLVALIQWLLRTRTQKLILLSLLLAMGMASHVENTLTYRREWQTQKDFFWQLTWRAPQLKEGTTVLTFGLPLNYYSDNSLTAPLNWIYAPDNHSTQLPYLLAFTDVRVGAAIPELKKSLPIIQKYRNAEFIGNTSDMLVIFYSPPACLRILDSQKKIFNPTLPNDLSKAFPLSDVSQIALDTQAAIPPENIFGLQPPSEWCYYFQKADLAHQKSDWDTIAMLGDTAREKNLSAAEPTEYMVFIEGYAHTGDWERVKRLMEQAMKLNRNVNYQLCRLIARLEKDLSPTQINQNALESIQSDYQCQSY